MTALIKNTVGAFSTYHMLFGDMPLSYWASVGSGEIPWNLFKEVKKNIDNGDKAKAMDILHKIINMPGLESRHYLQAYHFLNNLQQPAVGGATVFGVVLEISMPQGNDVLAVYADQSARYYNYSGKGIIWEQPDNTMDALIKDILERSKNVVTQIGPWKEERPQPPVNKMARINFLTSKGLHFGEASQQVLFSDPMAGQLMYAMLNLMNALIDTSIPANEAAITS